MTASIKNVNNDFNLARAGLPQAINRAERIQANNREIAKLENEISIRKDNINTTKALIASNNETINVLEQLKSNGEKLLDSHIQARDASMKVVDLSNKQIESNNKLIESNDKMLDLMQQMIAVMEKMVAIIEKNPARYGGLSSLKAQKQPEVIEAKNQVTELTNKKVNEYPLNIRPVLEETAKKVINATFNEIKPNNPQANRELFSNLTNRLELEIDKKYEFLAKNNPAKEFLISVNRFLEIFSKVKRLPFLDSNIKNIKT